MLTKRMKYNLAVVLLIGWMIVMFSMSHQTATESSKVSLAVAETSAEVLVNTGMVNSNFNMSAWHSKVRVNGHFMEYILLAILAMNVFSRTRHKKKAYGLVIFFSMCFILSDETHQIFRAGRDFQVFDMIVDMIGVFVGLLISFLVLRFSEMRTLENKVHGAFERYSDYE